MHKQLQRRLPAAEPQGLTHLLEQYLATVFGTVLERGAAAVAGLRQGRPTIVSTVGLWLLRRRRAPTCRIQSRQSLMRSAPALNERADFSSTAMASLSSTSLLAGSATAAGAPFAAGTGPSVAGFGLLGLFFFFLALALLPSCSLPPAPCSRPKAFATDAMLLR